MLGKNAVNGVYPIDGTIQTTANAALLFYKPTNFIIGKPHGTSQFARSPGTLGNCYLLAPETHRTPQFARPRGTLGNCYLLAPCLPLVCSLLAPCLPLAP